MNYIKRIALKYIFTIRKFQFITFISFLSALGITIGVCALIIVTALFNGFRDFAQKEIIGIDPHIRIISKPNQNIELEKIFRIISTKSDARCFPFLSMKAIIQYRSNLRAVELFGIEDSVYLKHPIHKKTVLNLPSPKSNHIVQSNILIGIGLADALRLLPGEVFTVVTIEDIDKAISYFIPPTKREIMVGSIFQTNNNNYDNFYIFLPKSMVSNFLKDSKSVNKGVDIRLGSIKDVNKIAKDLRAELPTYNILTWYDLNKDVMNAMQFEKYAVFLILSLIISIAVFNILASLYMTVVEKQPDISILLALGATTKDIKKIFHTQGLLIGILSTFLGALLGLGFTIGQIEYGWLKLNTQKYVISALPMKISIPTIVAIIFVSILLSYLSTIYPAYKASRIKVVDGIFRE